MPSEDEPASAPKQTRPWPMAIGVGAVAAVLAIVWNGLSPDPEPWLQRARRSLSALTTPADPATRLILADQARIHLQKYLAAGGREQESARLLLTTVRITAGSVFDPGDTTEVDFAVIRLGECSTSDLVTAARVLVTEGQPGQSSGLIEEALRRDDHRAETLHAAALVSYETGREEAALANANELAALSSDDPRPWLIMAHVYEDRGHYDQLVPVYRRLLETNGADHAELLQRLTDSELRTGAMAEARQSFETLKQSGAGDRQTTLVLEARLANAEGNADKAAELLETVLIEYPGSVEGRLLSARLMLARQDPAGAIAILTRLVSDDPTNAEAHYLLGQAHARNGNRELADQHLEAHRRWQDLRVRIHRLERMAGFYADNVRVRHELAALYREAGLPELARFWEDSARTIQPRP